MARVGSVAQAQKRSLGLRRAVRSAMRSSSLRQPDPEFLLAISQSAHHARLASQSGERAALHRVHEPDAHHAVSRVERSEDAVLPDA